MTDITELALLVSKAKASVFTLKYISQFEPADIDSDDVDLRFEVDGVETGTNVSIVDECGQAAKVIGALVEALEKAQHEAAVDWEAAASLNVENQELKRRIAELEDAEQKLCAANVTLDARAELAERQLAELESRTVTAAAADVLAERKRQVTAEGWSPKHDDQYKNTELAFAASCYAFHAAAASWDLEDDGIPYDSHPAPKQWPWDPSWWKPTGARRDLVKAGALILAEIERLDRAAGIKWEGE